MPASAKARSALPSELGAKRPPAAERFQLPLARSFVRLPAGRHAVRVTIPEGSFVTVGVLGAHDALHDLHVMSHDPRLRTLQAPGVLADDTRLPKFVSFETTSNSSPASSDVAEAKPLMVVVDARSPVKLVRISADSRDLAPPPPKWLKVGHREPRRLIGFPFPLGERAGYLLGSAHRYHFVRADVAKALRGALRQTAVRFRRGPLVIGDISQWNGQRPASDMDQPRHISHQGGRDVDIALASSKGGVSEIVRRCRGTLVTPERLECSPGTVKDFDAMRMAYFLGLLIDGPTHKGRYVPSARRRRGPLAMVETIYADQAFIDEIRKALEVLRDKHWIHEEAYGALGEDGILRHSPWHTDHVHLRFMGEHAHVPEAFREVVAPLSGKAR
jgi:hypothetical protein